MEASFRKSAHGGVVKEEKKGEFHGDDEAFAQEVILKVGNGRKDHKDSSNSKSSSPDHQDFASARQGPAMTKIERSSAEPSTPIPSTTQKEQDDRLKSAKAEMGEVMEENQRLRMYLDRIMKDYRTLQMQFREIAQKEAEKSTGTVTSAHQEEEEEEANLVSLSLGRCSSDPKKDETCKISSKEKIDHEEDKEGLSLGLDFKFEAPKATPVGGSPQNPSPENSLEEVKEEAGETWLPNNKAMKTSRNEEEDVSQQNPAKRARVSVRVRCDAPTMNDGCQWRKYGQKIAKGNPCPRAYYRCTIAPSCPVRKQVQRCADDMSILITTYEGTHNHPLPLSATTMASTTSAAATMLMSGSSTSASGASSSSTSANIYGLNFYLSDNSSRLKPFYLPNSSISSSLAHPTITLDLTSTSSSLSSSSSHLNRVLTGIPQRYSSTNLNFSSLESSALPISFSNGVLTYGSQFYNKSNQIGNSLSFGKQPQENSTTLYQPYLQKNITNNQTLPADTIAAATKAIASDPNFQSALAAALTSIIGSNNGTPGAVTHGNYQNPGDKLPAQNLKQLVDQPFHSSFPSTSNANKCASSFSNTQQGSLMFVPPSLPFSGSKSKSTSPGDSRDHVV